ncbi:hypothetical protein [Actinospica robiniae]|uniref:hypothetical protein n=1 Tax=Actinospica robiniae TaxID=304901 RepID=UPI0003F7F6AA|nr:hypothetical protein [Actinospica robiniae]
MTRAPKTPLPETIVDPSDRTQADPAETKRLRLQRWGALTIWAALTSIWFARRGGYSWHYFVHGSALLFDGASGGAPTGGMHIYADYPQLQIGPVSFVVAQGLRHMGPANGLYAAEIFMTGLGLVALHVIERIAAASRPEAIGDRRWHHTMLVGGAPFMIGWTDLSVAYAHLDDVLALIFALVALWSVAAGLPALTGVCLGLSVDAKPWSLVFLPMILALPRRAWHYAAAWTTLVVMLGWLPFVAADFHTVAAASQFTITNERDSALRALGVGDPVTPRWDRAAQIALACLLGAEAVRRRRWPALILLGVGARVALDPGVYGYYTAGVLLGALLWDLVGSGLWMPIWTVASGAVLAATPLLISDAALRGQMRLSLVIAFTCALLFGPTASSTHTPATDNRLATLR